jgi:hypothetical protein
LPSENLEKRVKRCPESCAKHDDTMAIAMRREVDLEVLTKSLTQKLRGATLGISGATRELLASP